jgi:hypothetical protein
VNLLEHPLALVQKSTGDMIAGCAKDNGHFLRSVPLIRKAVGCIGAKLGDIGSLATDFRGKFRIPSRLDRATVFQVRLPALQECVDQVAQQILPATMRSHARIAQQRQRLIEPSIAKGQSSLS